MHMPHMPETGRVHLQVENLNYDRPIPRSRGFTKYLKDIINFESERPEV
jgi:hypothetical protein